MKMFTFFLLAAVVATVVAMIRDKIAAREHAKRGWSTDGLSMNEVRQMTAVWFRAGYLKTDPEARETITKKLMDLRAEDKELALRRAPKGFTGHFHLLGILFAESMDETMGWHQDSFLGSFRRMAWRTMEIALLGYGIFITVCLIGINNPPIPGFEHNWPQLMAKYCSLPWGIAVATTGYLTGLALCGVSAILFMFAAVIGSIGTYFHHLLCLIPPKA
jgi:hypothetical protein